MTFAYSMDFEQTLKKSKRTSSRTVYLPNWPTVSYFHISFQYHPSEECWTVNSTIPGLNIETDTIEEAQQEVKLLAPDLIRANMKHIPIGTKIALVYEEA